MKHTHFRQTTLATIRVRTIYSLVLRFCQLHPLPKRRGRPCKYSEALILTLWLLAVRENASYRRLLFALAPEILPDHPLPALGTLAYRLQHLADKRLQQLLHWLAQQGMASETLTCETPCVFVDGTGVGYASPFFAQYLRGAQIRQQRSHVKVVALVYWQGGRAWVIGLSCGAAYADEGRLLGEWVERYGRGGLGSGTLLVGDRLYGYRARLLKQLEEAGWLPVARVEAGLHQQVRADARLRARLRAEVYGWALGERYRIEQVFGSVKSAYGSVWRARSWEGARVWVWGMFVLWNMVGLVRVLGDGSDGFIVCCVWVRGGWVIFRTPSIWVDFPVAGSGVGAHGELLIVVLRVHAHRQTYLLEVGETRGLPCLLPCLSEHWEQNSRQYRDNRDDHQQLDQSESVSLHDVNPPFVL